MTVLCNIMDCGYYNNGLCCFPEYLKIKNGTCEWLINNPNYRTRSAFRVSPQEVIPVKESEQEEGKDIE